MCGCMHYCNVIIFYFSEKNPEKSIQNCLIHLSADHIYHDGNMSFAKIPLQAITDSCILLCEQVLLVNTVSPSLDGNSNLNENTTLDPNSNLDQNTTLDPNRNLDQNTTLDPNRNLHQSTTLDGY